MSVEIQQGFTPDSNESSQFLESLAVTEFNVCGLPIRLRAEPLGKGGNGQLLKTNNPLVAAKISGPLSEDQVQMFTHTRLPFDQTMIQVTDDMESIAIQGEEDVPLCSIREASALFKLLKEHPDLPIVRPYQVNMVRGKDGYHVVFFMQRLQKHSLHSEVTKYMKTFEQKRFLVDSLSSVAQAIDIMNNRPKRMLHGDLKAEDILTDENGNWTLTDFGITMEGDISSKVVLGSPSYMARERLWGKNYPASEQYLYGKILSHVLLNGREARILKDPKTGSIISETIPHDFDQLVEEIYKGTMVVDVPKLTSWYNQLIYNNHPESWYDSMSLAELTARSLDTVPEKRWYNCRMLQKLTRDILYGRVEAMNFAHISYLSIDDADTGKHQDRMQKVIDSIYGHPGHHANYADELYFSVKGSELPENQDSVQTILELLTSPPAEFARV